MNQCYFVLHSFVLLVYIHIFIYCNYILIYVIINMYLYCTVIYVYNVPLFMFIMYRYLCL